MHYCYSGRVILLTSTPQSSTLDVTLTNQIIKAFDLNDIVLSNFQVYFIRIVLKVYYCPIVDALEAKHLIQIMDYFHWNVFLNYPCWCRFVICSYLISMHKHLDMLKNNKYECAALRSGYWSLFFALLRITGYLSCTMIEQIQPGNSTNNYKRGEILVRAYCSNIFLHQGKRSNKHPSLG